MADLGPVAWPPEPIRTERLVLRAPEARDRAAAIELLASPEVGSYLGGPRPRDELEREVPGAPRRRPGLFAVDLDGAMIGQVILSRATGHGPPAAAGQAELGYRFLPRAWGLGYAAEACAAALGWLAGELPGEPVVLFTQTANGRSMRLAAKLGFTEVERYEAYGAEQWFGLRSPARPHRAQSALGSVPARPNRARRSSRETGDGEMAESDLTEIAAGDLPSGEHWILRAGGPVTDFGTFLQTTYPDGRRDEGGMRGPLLWPGSVMNVYTGGAESGPRRVVARADLRVALVRVQLASGARLELPPVATMADPGLAFFATLLPRTAALASVTAVDADGQVLESQNLAGHELAWQRFQRQSGAPST